MLIGGQWLLLIISLLFNAFILKLIEVEWDPVWAGIFAAHLLCD